MIPEEMYCDPIAAKVYDNMRQLIPGKDDKLDSLFSGCRIIGAEPMNWPSPEGVSLYLADKTGKRYAVDIAVRVSCKKPRLMVQWAEIPERM